MVESVNNFVSANGEAAPKNAINIHAGASLFDGSDMKATQSCWRGTSRLIMCDWEKRKRYLQAYQLISYGATLKVGSSPWQFNFSPGSIRWRNIWKFNLITIWVLSNDAVGVFRRKFMAALQLCLIEEDEKSCWHRLEDNYKIWFASEIFRRLMRNASKEGGRGNDTKRDRSVSKYQAAQHQIVGGSRRQLFIDSFCCYRFGLSKHVFLWRGEKKRRRANGVSHTSNVHVTGSVTALFGVATSQQLHKREPRRRKENRKRNNVDVDDDSLHGNM